MLTWIAVAVGGAVGSVARHGVSHLVHVHHLSNRFPAATVVVNIAGCFLIGLLAGLVARERIALRFYSREFLLVGVLGGFTTFSTFGLDTLVLARTHTSGLALAYVLSQVGGGLAAVWLGYRIGLVTF